MDASNVIEQTEDFRLGILADDSADPPYDDGRTPILAWDRRRDRARYIDNAGGQPPAGLSGILEALERWGIDRGRGEPDLFARFLRMAHGTTEIETWRDSRGDGTEYVTFDTRAWREHHGIPDDVTGVASLDDWRAYCEGEVYGWVIERRVRWNRTDDADAHLDTWEHFDSCWGYYGYDDVAGEARREWEAFLAAQDKQTGEQQA